MSEIPFVNRLGDALDAAIAVPRPAPRRLFGRRRRIGVLALAVLLVGATGATVARVLVDSDELAAGSVACFERADLSGNVAVLGTVTGSPTVACAEAWRSGPRPPLVACAREAAVVVFPGRGPRACARAGLAPLPVSFEQSQAKVARLQRDAAALEAAADCIPPERLAERAGALLARAGWTGWRAEVGPLDGGPCGHILTRGGSGQLSLSGTMDATRHVLMISGGPPRALDEQLYGERSLSVLLMDASGERCHTVAELEDVARRELGVTKRRVGFKHGSLPADTGITGARGDRYAEGCAIVVDTHPVYPRPGAVELEVEIWSKGG